MVRHFGAMPATTLIIRYKDANGAWQRALAAHGANGRVKPGHAWIGSRPVLVGDYKYQVRYYENRKIRYLPAGTNASDAETLRRRIEQQLTAKVEAEKAGLKIEARLEERVTLARSAARYLKDAEDRGASESARMARLASDAFVAMVRKTYVDEVNRDDIFRFHAALRKRGYKDRTVANKHQWLASWLRYAGIDPKILPPKPKYEETLPTIYTRDETSTLLGAAGPNMHLAISLALKCGLRDGELMHAEFTDINWAEKTLRVQGKPRWAFKVKTHEQRDVPVPDDLIEELRGWHKQKRGQSLILATSNGRPNGKLLFTLKTLARNAGLNCGRCEKCHSKRRECEEFTLHKFRRTYITTLLRGGVDLRTVQAYAGHKDIASTMRYLRPASAKEAQAKLNTIEW